MLGLDGFYVRDKDGVTFSKFRVFVGDGINKTVKIIRIKLA